MPTERRERRTIETASDVVLVRQAARAFAAEAGLSLVDQTKLITAASELARNTLDYGGGGFVQIDMLDKGGRRGVQLVFEDQGPGIEDIQLALKDGYSTGSGLGLGVGGSRRLVNEFSIQSQVGQGTRVTIVRWK